MTLTSPSFPRGLPPTRTPEDVLAARRAHVVNCPFCGMDPPLATSGRFGGFVIACDNDDCPAQPQVTGKTIAEAWSRWNGARS